jgi:glycosyltransferase involved in cell wall biosynthesis
VVGQEARLLVNPDNCQAFAQAIEFLLDQPKLATEYGRAARVKVQALFNFDRYVDASEAVYRKLITGAEQ